MSRVRILDPKMTRLILKPDHGVGPGNSREISGKFPGNFREMSGTFPGNVREISGKCPGIFREFSGNFPEKKTLMFFYKAFVTLVFCKALVTFVLFL